MDTGRIAYYETPRADFGDAEDIILSISQGSYRTTVKQEVSALWRSAEGEAIPPHQLASRCRD